MSEQFDLIVLGSGSGARDGANKAAMEHDARVAVIENTRWGGGCPNVACKPTKAYLVAAELAHDIETLAEPLGIEVGAARIILAKVKARKDSLIVPAETWMERLHGAGHATFDGTGSFVDPQTVQVNGTQLKAPSASSSRPARAPRCRRSTASTRQGGSTTSPCSSRPSCRSRCWSSAVGPSGSSSPRSSPASARR